jgi:formiminoglutamase
MPIPDMSVWQGRTDTADGPNAVRWHQRVEPLPENAPPGIALIGFACDEGVRRNGGRVGAAEGPMAIRQALAKLAWHQSSPVYDAGDVSCTDADLEGAQSRLARVVSGVIAAGHRPLILGGGHETAWGTFQGVVAAHPKKTIGVINIDAHLDLRGDEPGNSGTPFYQIAKWCAANGRPFHYLCLGTSMASNTLALFERAAKLGAAWLPDAGTYIPPRMNSMPIVDKFAESLDVIHVSIDLDVLPAGTMPAVSAPAGRGVALDCVLSLATYIYGLRKTVAVDVVEFNPKLDHDQNAVRVAAHLVWDTARWWSKSCREAPEGKS